MKIAKRGRYALRIMLDLAVNSSGEYIPIKNISQRQNITVKHMEQIINPLCKAGLLKSSRGSSGGYRLARKPDEYRIGEILRVMEGNLSMIPCLEDDPNECPRADGCLTLPFWEGLKSVLENYVDSVTLKDLMPQIINENS